MQRILFFLWLLPFSVSADPADFSGTMNLPSIPSYPNATIVRYDEGEKVNYPLVASTIKKVNGVVRADEEQRFDGRWRRIIYLMPDGHGSEAGFHYFSDRLSQLGAETLYDCDGRHCGPSNLWANKIFEEASLYGLDKEQFYSLSSRQVDGHTEYYVLYTVKRGNRRVYAMVDQLIVEGLYDVPATSDRRHQGGAYSSDRYIDVVMNSGSGAALQHDIDKILPIVKRESTIVLLLAGSVPATSAQTVEQQIENSRQYGQALKTQLMGKGVPGERLVVIGTGPLLRENSGSPVPFVRVMPVK